MNKSYSGLPILSDVIKRRKKRERFMLFLGIIGMLIFAVILFAATKGKHPFLVSLFTLFFITGMIHTCLQVEKLIRKVIEKAGFDSYEKMELFLGKCQRLCDLIFISDDKIIDFFKYEVINRRSITHAEAITQDEDSDRAYTVKIKVRAEGTKYLCFKNIEERDKAYKIISSAIEFSDRKLLD